MKILKMYTSNINDRFMDEVIDTLRLMDRRRDLYDLQVATVHEFYANNIVSHKHEHQKGGCGCQ